jgi:hypothetical protein
MNLMRVFLAQLLTAAMILVGLLMAFHYDWPDYVHTDYGVPLLWATHTESTIMGTADIWSINTANLIADLAIWTILSLALVALTSSLQRKRTISSRARGSLIGQSLRKTD